MKRTKKVILVSLFIVYIKLNFYLFNYSLYIIPGGGLVNGGFIGDTGYAIVDETLRKKKAEAGIRST